MKTAKLLRGRSTKLLRGSVLMAISATALSLDAAAAPSGLAPRPPMGWNSWDAYGLTLDEAQYRANASVLAGWTKLGWTYAVIDEGWYMADPAAETVEARRYLLDGFGRLEPDPARFPSAAGGHGFKALADWTHAHGMKFGIHIVRGIPKAAVDANLPVHGSRYHAVDAADRTATCPWDKGNYGIADNEAGQAYYDSLIREYADWGVDFLKVDCIADHPYRPSEIAQIGRAIRKTGRSIVLSLSPGPAQIDHLSLMVRNAQMWRIGDDFWDSWSFPHPDPKSTFPNGVSNFFDLLAKWSPLNGPNRWPDADMLPFGVLRPHPGWGDPRESRLTPDEVRTTFTLWAIARSPLILGANLTMLDPETRAIVSNRAVIALDQEDRTGYPLVARSDLPADARIWLSAPAGRNAPDTIALFNLGASPLRIDAAWSTLGSYAPRSGICDLWSGETIPPDPTRLTIEVAPHGVRLLRLASAGGCPKV